LALYFIFFNPNLLGHPDNYIPANPLVTPTHIVPEWYFLPFYAILRCIPNKLLGVIALVASILVLLLLPFISRNFKIRTSSFTPLRKLIFWFFLSDCILLAWLGGNVAEEPYITMSTYLTIFYFFYLTFLLFFFNKIDEFLIKISIKNNGKKN
jgi:ubiquinol-cytochrome c reductase cytochrome b subunit